MGTTNGAPFGAEVALDSLQAFLTEPGDANLDERVDLSDFLILKAHFGHLDQGWEQGDFNGNGVPDLGDFAILKENFGYVRPESSVAAVPEPTSAWLAAVALVLLAGLRGRLPRGGVSAGRLVKTCR